MTWRDTAACSPIVVSPETDLWHECEGVGSGHTESKQARDKRVTAAKKICATCPVKQACLDTATRDDLGIRGGLTMQERLHPRKPCGTAAAYRRHLNERTTPCEPCLDAAKTERQARQRRAKEAA